MLLYFFYYQLIIKSDIGRLVFSSERDWSWIFQLSVLLEKNNSTNRSLEKFIFGMNLFRGAMV